MNPFWTYDERELAQGHKTLLKWMGGVGAFLLLLAVLIFMFPALVAFIIASFILFAGISTLVVGYRLWKLRDRIQVSEWVEDPFPDPFRMDSPYDHSRRVTYIRWWGA